MPRCRDTKTPVLGFSTPKVANTCKAIVSDNCTVPSMLRGILTSIEYDTIVVNPLSVSKEVSSCGVAILLDFLQHEYPNNQYTCIRS